MVMAMARSRSKGTNCGIYCELTLCTELRKPWNLNCMNDYNLTRRGVNNASVANGMSGAGA